MLILCVEIKEELGLERKGDLNVLMWLEERCTDWGLQNPYLEFWKIRKTSKRDWEKNHLCSRRETWRVYLLSGQVKTVTHVVGSIFFFKCCLQFKKREGMKKNNSSRRIQWENFGRLLGIKCWMDGMGREEGGGFRMGNTCIPVTDSFWYLAKLI